MYGIWYRPASGLYSLSNIINKNTKNEEINKKNNSFFFRYNLKIKKIIINKIKKLELTQIFNGRKKLINKAAKDEPMIPIITQSTGVFKSKLKNFVIKNLPKTR